MDWLSSLQVQAESLGKKTLKIEPFKPSSSRSQYSNVPLSKQIKLLDKAIKIKSISIQCRLEVFSL